MVIKIHYNALKQIQKMLEDAKSTENTIRITANGHSWSGVNWNIVLDEQRDGDVVTEDKGIKILIHENLAKLISNATIEYKQTFAGYKFVLK